MAPDARPKVLVKPRRERVLVVMHSDGWIEVYARRNVDVRMVNRLHVVGGDPTEVAHILDELVEYDIPKCYRWLYYPNRRRGCGQVRQITPEEKLAMLDEVDLIRDVQWAGKEAS